MINPRKEEQCRLEPEHLAEMRGGIPPVVEELVGTCGTEECFEHVSPAPMPSVDRVVEIIELSRRVLFPGYFHPEAVDLVNLRYQMGQETAKLFELVAEQSMWAVRHECLRHDLSCSQCGRTGQEAALGFVQSLPRLRRALAKDIRAAVEGDPAVSGPDEVIFSYPGLFAITVHRLAHAMLHLEVPLIPRMMTEHAHGKTGIDLHPAAEIGESFFIDHGTGVVVGQTAEIGDRVRVYQGVTLGALSLPPGAGRTMRDQKRHPTIEHDVIIYAGATILGGETVVGARSVIGGNVWLTESVPPDTKVLMKKPELVYLGAGKAPGEGKSD